VSDGESGPANDRESGLAQDTAFYDSVYGNFGRRLAATIRAEVFDEDIGQNSWLTAGEQRKFCRWLELDASSEVLEIASGSGGPALFMVRETGCSMIGIELHQAGVSAATEAAKREGLAARARFMTADAREPLPFDSGSFGVVLCIDSINHMYERAEIFEEWHRMLRRGGRVLFTNPLTVSGMLRRAEMAIRTGSLGEQVFSPPGVDEKLLRAAGFADIRIEDLTANMAAVSAARRRARAGHVAELSRLEGQRESVRYDRYLSVVELLATERRLTRLAYIARASRVSMAGRRADAGRPSCFSWQQLDDHADAGGPARICQDRVDANAPPATALSAAPDLSLASLRRVGPFLTGTAALHAGAAPANDQVSGTLSGNLTAKFDSPRPWPVTRPALHAVIAPRWVRGH
jgi:cyclopropane fatty-acyl-phospholipid synthase-like methyltransferase